MLCCYIWPQYIPQWSEEDTFLVRVLRNFSRKRRKEQALGSFYFARYYSNSTNLYVTVISVHYKTVVIFNKMQLPQMLKLA